MLFKRTCFGGVRLVLFCFPRAGIESLLLFVCLASFCSWWISRSSLLFCFVLLLVLVLVLFIVFWYLLVLCCFQRAPGQPNEYLGMVLLPTSFTSPNNHILHTYKASWSCKCYLEKKSIMLHLCYYYDHNGDVYIWMHLSVFLGPLARYDNFMLCVVFKILHTISAFVDAAW